MKHIKKWLTGIFLAAMILGLPVLAEAAAKNKGSIAGKRYYSGKPMIAITYDNGPGAYTDRLLDCLEKNDASATFFLLGCRIPQFPETVKRMALLGCELGCHSYSHRNFTALSSKGIRDEIKKTVAEIVKASGQTPTVLRLPNGDGAKSRRVLSVLGYPSIYWSVCTRDWAYRGNPRYTVNAVLNQVKDGDIILLHDVHKSTVEASEKLIPELKKRGFQLVTVSELARYKGRTRLKSGRTYYHFR